MFSAQSKSCKVIFDMASSRYEQTKWATALLAFIIQSRKADQTENAARCISLLSAKAICLSERIAPKLADKRFLCEMLDAGPTQTFLSKILKDIWCDPVFIKHEKSCHHSTLTQWILILLDVDSIKPIVPIDFYNAMTLYLDHWNEEIRVGAMFVAEKLSPFLTLSENQQQVLSFDGFDSHPVYVKWANFITANNATIETVETVDSVETVDNVKSSPLSQNEVVASFDSDDDDDDDSLLPDIPSLDIKPSSKDDVIYIRDAMALLKRSLDDTSNTGNGGKNEDWLEKRERALIKLKSLIEGCGELALRDIALDLSNILLHLDPSTFSFGGIGGGVVGEDSTNDASQLRHQCISLLMFKCPDLVAAYLYGEFFSDRVNLGQRLDFMRFWIPGTLSLARCGFQDGKGGKGGDDTNGRVGDVSSLGTNGKIIRMSSSLKRSPQPATKSSESSSCWTSRSIPFLVLPLLNALYDEKNVNVIVQGHPLLHRLCLSALHLLFERGVQGSIHEARLSHQLNEFLEQKPHFLIQQ